MVMSRKNVKNYTEQNAAGHLEPAFGAIRSTRWCTPGMGVNLWAESPLYMNPVNVKNIEISTSRRQGRACATSNSGAGQEPKCGSYANWVRRSKRPSQWPTKPQRTWRLSRTLATQTGMTNDWLKDQRLLSIKELWVHIHYPATRLPAALFRFIR